MAVPKKSAKMDKFTHISRKIEKTANFMHFRIFVKKNLFFIKIKTVGSERLFVQKERENMH